MKEGEPKPEPQSERPKQKEHGEPFCTCLYCTDNKLGLHRIETIDGVTEWVCGRHKRRADLTGLASFDIRKPTEKDQKLAAYIRDIIVKLPAIVTNPATDEERRRILDARVGTIHIDDLPSVDMQRYEAISVESHNAALVDVLDAFEEGKRGFEDRIEAMMIDNAELSEIEGWYETQDRNYQIIGYNKGLLTGYKTLTTRSGGDVYDGMDK